jgi:hypothetical protein
VFAHSVVAVAVDELVPLVGLLPACRSALELYLELVLMPVLVPVHELEPELELEPAEPEPEIEGCKIWAVILVPALMDVPLHQLSDFDLDFVPPCTELFGRPYFAAHRSVGLSFAGGIADVVVEPGLAEAALAKAGE